MQLRGIGLLGCGREPEDHEPQLFGLLSLSLLSWLRGLMVSEFRFYDVLYYMSVVEDLASTRKSPEALPTTPVDEAQTRGISCTLGAPRPGQRGDRSRIFALGP